MSEVEKLINGLLRLQDKLVRENDDPWIKERIDENVGNVAMLAIYDDEGITKVTLKLDSDMKIRKTNEEPKHVITMHVDSVPGYSPIVIKNELGYVNILPLEDLWHNTCSPVIRTEKGEEVKFVNLYTLSDKPWYWSRVRAIVRHWYEGPLVRLKALSGVVDVTPNHSVAKIYGSSVRVVDARDIKEGDVLLTGAITFSSTPKHKRHGEFFIGSKDLAYLYGLLASDGCINTYNLKYKRGTKMINENRGMIIFTNKSRDLALKAKELIESNFNISTSISRSKSEDMYNVKSYNKRLAGILRSKLYTASGEKRVPVEILNAPKHIKEAFIKGYIDGDGSIALNGMPTYCSKSWVLAQGVLALVVDSGLVDSWFVSVRDDKPNIVKVNINKEEPVKRRGKVTKMRETYYKGYVYDLVTDSGYFMTGVGNILVHNTFLDLLSGNLDFRDAYLKGWLDFQGEDYHYHCLMWAKSFERLRGKLRKYGVI